jgi:hypothetical protein
MHKKYVIGGKKRQKKLRKSNILSGSESGPLELMLALSGSMDSMIVKLQELMNACGLTALNLIYQMKLP